MNSLDPRVLRLPAIGEPGMVNPKPPLDQFISFEVFVQPKEDKPFQHEGIVHAPNVEMAYVLAKETFTRRFTCVSLYVVDTSRIWVSAITDGVKNAYETISKVASSGIRQTYEIYHLTRRGKQHVHVGQVEAGSPEEAASLAAEKYNTKTIYNIWIIKTADIRFTEPGDKDLWLTLPEKRFRDAADYKGGDKLRDFLERQKTA